MTAALAWGALAASSLVIGALIGLLRPWPPRLVGLVLAFGAGALISAVSFDLAEEGASSATPGSRALGLALGALTYFAPNRLVERRSRRRRRRRNAAALALGAFLDGIPEQAVLGIGLAAGEGVSVGLLVAIFVSNLPEAIGSSTAMRAAGRGGGDPSALAARRRRSAPLATVVGYASPTTSRATSTPAIDGFAAGALLVMLIDSMIPEAVRKGGDVSGLVTVLGFAVAAALSSVS